jgi:hypothetical protein
MTVTPAEKGNRQRLAYTVLVAAGVLAVLAIGVATSWPRLSTTTTVTKEIVVEPVAVDGICTIGRSTTTYTVATASSGGTTNVVTSTTTLDLSGISTSTLYQNATIGVSNGGVAEGVCTIINSHYDVQQSLPSWCTCA